VIPSGLPFIRSAFPMPHPTGTTNTNY